MNSMNKLLLVCLLLILLVACSMQSKERNTEVKNEVSQEPVNLIDEAHKQETNEVKQEEQYVDLLGSDLENPEKFTILSGQSYLYVIIGKEYSFSLDKIIDESTVRVFIQDDSKLLKKNVEELFDNNFKIKVTNIEKGKQFLNGRDVVKVYIGTKDGLIQSWLKEREAKTYDLNGNIYEVAVDIISDMPEPKVVLTINGKRLKSMKEKETELLGAKEFVFVGDILLNEAGEKIERDAVDVEIR